MTFATFGMSRGRSLGLAVALERRGAAAPDRSVFGLDDSVADPYVPNGMNLLMLLSALLSALTSVGAAVRRPEVAQAVAQMATAADETRGTTVVAAARPVAAWPTLRRIAGVANARGFVLTPAIAPWASRRRE